MTFYTIMYTAYEKGMNTMFDEKKLNIISKKPGFIAALDESLRSTPSVLRAYGIPDETYHSKEEMLNLVHDMRSRIIISSDFSSTHVIAAILFVDTLNRKIAGMPTSQYLWEEKEIIAFLKIDEGLAVLNNDVQLMNPINDLEKKLENAKVNKVFGTKMKSLILGANPEGIEELVDQQFTYAKQILNYELLPIIETEVDIHCRDKDKAEVLLKKALLDNLNQLSSEEKVIIEVTLPVVPDFYEEIISHPNVIRVLASSGGYKQAEADRKLRQNHGMIASFSRALEEGLKYSETDFEFDMILKETIAEIFDASIQ